jgi:hypothetical protein
LADWTTYEGNPLQNVFERDEACLWYIKSDGNIELDQEFGAEGSTFSSANQTHTRSPASLTLEGCMASYLLSCVILMCRVDRLKGRNPTPASTVSTPIGQRLADSDLSLTRPRLFLAVPTLASRALDACDSSHAFTL